MRAMELVHILSVDVTGCVVLEVKINELSNNRVIQPLMKFWIRNPEP